MAAPRAEHQHVICNPFGATQILRIYPCVDPVVRMLPDSWINKLPAESDNVVAQ